MSTRAQQYVRCGKKTCKSCPHGPYWYEFSYDKATHKHKSKYLGKTLPEEKEQPKPDPDTKPPQPHKWDAIFAKRTANTAIAAEILGIAWPSTGHTLTRVYLALAKRYHPDSHVEPDARRFKWIAAAYSFLKAKL